MKTITFSDQNDVYIEPKSPQNTFSPSLNSVYDSLACVLKSVKTCFKSIVHKFKLLLIRHSADVYRTVEINHLHRSCRKIDNPKREVFFLYLKGYSIDEITSVSGVSPHNIIMIVHNTMRTIHKDASLGLV